MMTLSHPLPQLNFTMLGWPHPFSLSRSIYILFLVAKRVVFPAFSQPRMIRPHLIFSQDTDKETVELNGAEPRREGTCLEFILLIHN